MVGEVYDREPIGVYADAENREQVELRIVPEADRTHKKYGGYSLSISTSDLNTKFKLVEMKE